MAKMKDIDIERRRDQKAAAMSNHDLIDAYERLVRAHASHFIETAEGEKEERELRSEILARMKHDHRD